MCRSSTAVCSLGPGCNSSCTHTRDQPVGHSCCVKWTFMLCEVQCWSTQYHPTASGEISAPRRHVLGTNTRPMDHVRCKVIWYLAAWFKHATDTPQMRARRHTSCVNCKVRMLHAAVSNLEPHHSPTIAPSRPHNSPITAQSQFHHSLITASSQPRTCSSYYNALHMGRQPESWLYQHADAFSVTSLNVYHWFQLKIQAVSQ